MWNIFDQWIVLLAIGWAVWVIYRSLSRKTCNQPCEKKIFVKEPLIGIGLKSKINRP